MKRLSLLTLVFALLWLVFLMLLIFLRFPFPPYPLMSVQDAADHLTPLVLVPLYWLMFKHGSRRAASGGEEIAFMMLAALWVLGQGMHLSANSINNLAEALAKQKTVDITGTSLYTLTYFYDEYLSHYLWYGAVVALALLVIYREWREPAGVATVWAAAIPAGVIHGFSLFANFLEGQVAALGLAFAFAVTALGLEWGRKRLAAQPLSAFFFVACLVALALFLAWGIYWRGFPQFSDVGLI